MVYWPTVRAYDDFNPEEDAQTLRAAMKGFGTDEEPIVEILSKRSFQQRAEIAQVYKRDLGRDLADDLKSELGGELEDIMVALTYSYFEYLAKELEKAFKGIGTKEKIVMEILLTRGNAELQMLQEAYSEVCHSSLEDDIRSEMGGDAEKLLVSVLNMSRDESEEADSDRAQELAGQLFDAGENKLGTDEETFRQIFSQESFVQLNAISEAYEALSSKSLMDAVDSEMDGDIQMALHIILAVAKDKVDYLTEQIYECMQGVGTDDKTLIRLILARSELDLGAIKERYLEKYGKTLEHSIERETSGLYRNALVALVRGNA